MTLQALPVGQHGIAHQRLRLAHASIRLSVRPYAGRQILGVLHHVIRVRTEQPHLQVRREVQQQLGMRADTRNGLFILHFHPCQRIGYLAGVRHAVPRAVPVFMIGKSRVKGSRRIESLLLVHQIAVVLHRTEHADIAPDETVEQALRHIHIRCKIPHVFVDNHPFPAHIAQ